MSARVVAACMLMAFMVASQSVFSDEGDARKSALSSPIGKYVYGQISEFGKDKFMLDTQTGRLWRLVIVGEVSAADATADNPESDGYLALEPISYLNGKGENLDSQGNLTLTPR